MYVWNFHQKENILPSLLKKFPPNAFFFCTNYNDISCSSSEFEATTLATIDYSKNWFVSQSEAG